MVAARLLLLPTACMALQLAAVAPPVARPTAIARAPPAAMIEFDMSYIIGGGALFVGLGGGIALISFTENAGKKNADSENAQPCVVCKSNRVTPCTICSGTGRDEFAQYVAGVREEAGEIGGTSTIATTTVDDWEEGEKVVEMFADILNQFPVKVTGSDQCSACDGRGVVVCDNCQGTGIQPRYLERYSPDDFMD